MLPENQTPTGNTTEQENTSTPENETQNKTPVDEQQPTSAETNQRSIADIDNEIKANQSKRHGSAKKRYLGLNYVGHAIKDIGRHFKRKSLERKKQKKKNEIILNQKYYEFYDMCTCPNLRNEVQNIQINKTKEETSAPDYTCSKNQGLSGYTYYSRGEIDNDSKAKNSFTDLDSSLVDLIILYQAAYINLWNETKEYIYKKRSKKSARALIKYIDKQTDKYNKIKQEHINKLVHQMHINEFLKQIPTPDNASQNQQNDIMTFEQWCEHKKKKLIDIFKKVKTSAKSVKEGEQAVRAFIKVVTQCLNNKTADKKDIDLALRCATEFVKNKYHTNWRKNYAKFFFPHVNTFDFCPYSVTDNDQKRLYGFAVLCTTDDNDNHAAFEDTLKSISQLDTLTE